ncbi:MAG: PHP domain-containing protein [Deltaproteobacteria bacterium]|nr:PHP domain-containing protein [Deltaproteobacteria bacterium]
MIDYHIHTKLCNHARGMMGAYVKRAIEKGLKEICFLDHLTNSAFYEFINYDYNIFSNNLKS